MKILFLSHYFPPEVNAPATRTSEHCKEWVQHGHEVTVVTCAPNHPHGEIYPGYSNKMFQREDYFGIQVIRLWTYVTGNKGLVRRTLGYASYMLSVTMMIPFLPKADVIISTSPEFFNGLSGYLVSRLKRCPWVLEIRDLWPESIVAVGAIHNEVAINLLRSVEMFAYRKADRLVPVTNAFERYMIDKGIEPQKIQIIRHGVDLNFYNSKDEENPLVNDLGLQGKFVASYLGTHGMAHHLETILYAAKTLQSYPDIVFLMAGDGAERNRLVELKAQLELDNVFMLNQQPKSSMPYLWDLTDVSLVLLKKTDLFKTVMPTKIFESFAMRKPIILGVEGESQELVEAASGGLCIEPENSQELAERILELYRNPERVKQLGENGRQYVTKFHDRTVLANQFEKILEAIP